MDIPRQTSTPMLSSTSLQAAAGRVIIVEWCCVCNPWFCICRRCGPIIVVTYW